MVIHRNIGVGLVVAGAALVILAAILAYQSFYGYRLSLPLPSYQGQPASIETTITSLVVLLVELAAKLGFLGIMVWGGGILIKYGIQSLKPEHPQK